MYYVTGPPPHHWRKLKAAPHIIEGLRVARLSLTRLGPFLGKSLRRSYICTCGEQSEASSLE